MKKKFFSLFLLLFISISLCAQTNNFSIKGQVVDSLTNETVPYATLSIALATAPQAPVKLLACDEDGKFESTLNATGNYVMSLQSIGKTPATRTFTISANSKTVDLGKIYMSEDNQRLGEVTVTAQKPLVKIDIDKITYSLEDDPEAQTNNTLEMLRKVPMVTVDGEDKIQLKGSENFKIYLNGKPSNMLGSNTASDVLKSMPASSVKNIEVITDPGAKYDAEGVGGIINIITTTNSLQGYTASVNAEASVLGRYRGGVNITTKIGKLGLTGRYNYMYFNNPWTDSESFRENYNSTNAGILTQTGRSKFSGPRMFGGLEATYEIDTLNLLSLGFDIFNGKSKNKSELDAVMMYNADSIVDYNYFQRSNSSTTFGSMDMNLDYQHSTSKKDELFTISYKFSHSPNDNESKTYLENVNNYPYASIYPKWNVNDAATNEHTAQVDYTTPTRKDHTLEVGAKYIMRQSNSETNEHIYNDSTNLWEEFNRRDNFFKHTQHIYAGYFAYAIKFDKYSAKAGVRAEGTALSVKYKNMPESNFKSDFFDVVPNATLSYQINMAQQVRLGYNMRIYRPGIWHLNPYRNDTDPQNISYGNPNLKSEKSHGINLNYSIFTPKFNFNANASYRFVNNAIQRYSFVNNDGANETTYENMGKNNSVGVFLYGRWSPVKFFNISLNGGLDYTDLKGEYGLENNGFSGRVFAHAQFMLPKDFSINVNGGYFSPWIQLQSKGSTQYFHGITLSKNFLNKKLTVALSCQSPFEKNMKYTYTTTDTEFYQRNVNYFPMRDFRIRISYSFGTLKDSIKKVRRGISNDDTKSGESGGGGGGQEGM